MPYLRLIFLLSLCLLVAPVQSVFALQSQNLDVVKIQLRWSHQFQFAGYYAAIEKGFYKEEGLKVELLEFDPAQGRIAPVVNGVAQYGVSDASLVKSRLAGEPVVLLAQIFQHSPLVLLAKEESEIYSPLELAGKKVMYNLEDLPIRAALDGVLSDKVGYERVPHSHDPMDLVTGKVSAISAYLTDQAYFYQRLGIRLNIIDPRSYGYDFYGDNLFTTENEIKEHPDRVGKVIRATLKGWEYALAHQDEMIDLILLKYNPRLDRDQLAYEAKMTERMVLPHVVPVGTIDRNRYQTILQTLSALGEIENTSLPEGFIYNLRSHRGAFLTEAEEAWLKRNPEIYFAFPADNEPLLLESPSGIQEGLLVKFLSLMNGELGTNFKIKDSQDGGFRSLIDKKLVDGVLAGTSSVMQKLGLAASEPFTQITPVIYTKEDQANRFLSAADLVGKKIAHYAHSQLLDAILKPAQNDNMVVIADSPIDALRLVFEGKVDAMVGLSYHSLLLQKYYFPNIVPALTLTDLTVPVVMGVRPDQPELLSIVNKGIDAVGEGNFARVFSQAAREILPSNEIQFTEQEREWLKHNPSIRVGINNDFQPIEFLDKDGAPQGVSVDYLRRLEELLGIRVLFVPQPDSTSAMEAFRKGELDFEMALQEDSDRSDYLSFLPPHLSLPVSVFGRSDSDFIGSLTQLEGKTVALIDGDPLVKQILNDYPHIDIVQLKNIKQGLALLATGEVDAFIGALVVVSNYLSEIGNSSIKIIGDTHYSYDLSVAVSKRQPILKSLITKAMALITTKERDEIQRKWFTVKYEHGFDYSHFWQVAGVSLLFILVSLYWNLRLQKVVAIKEQAEQHFRNIVEGVQEDYLFYTHTAEGILDYISPGAERFLGCPAQDILGRNWRELPFTEDSLAIGEEVVESRLVNGVRRHTFEMTYNHPDGSQHIWKLSPFVQEGVELAKARVSGIIKDMTEERRQELALIAAKEQAEVANKAKSTFLANMSHELRTPLTAIIGYAHLLKMQKDLSPKTRERAETIDRSGQHLVRMINDVLEVSKIEAGQLTLKPEIFDPHKLFAELKEMFALQAKQKEISLVWEANLPAMRLEADVGKLRQVLINLIGNACKFTDTGRVEISCRHFPAEKDRVMLEIKVKDTGPGMSAEELGKMFQSFEQGESGRKKGGTGLGLVISQKYARLLGGDLTVASQQGKGSCFTFSCLAGIARTGPVESAQGSSQIIDYSKLSGRKFLIADDDPDNRGFIAGLLQTHGVITVEAEDGEQAIALALKEQPDMIIMDLRMPGVDGHGAIDKLKSSAARDIPILVATASVLGDKRERVEQSKLAYFTGKPIELEDFFDKIAQALDIPRVEDSDRPPSNASSSPAGIGDLSGLPDELLSQLKEALETLEPKRIDQAITGIAEVDAETGLALKRLAANFRYQEIGKLL